MIQVNGMWYHELPADGRCPGCEGRSAGPTALVDGHRLYDCGACGLRMAAPAPDEAAESAAMPMGDRGAGFDLVRWLQELRLSDAETPGLRRHFGALMGETEPMDRPSFPFPPGVVGNGEDGERWATDDYRAWRVDGLRLILCWAPPTSRLPRPGRLNVALYFRAEDYARACSHLSADARAARRHPGSVPVAVLP